MPFITREDGERFVIPSYRDVITAKNNAALKKEIITLSQSYGEYITMQHKAGVSYDVAFSPDLGYLLGESIWHYFKRPMDMIYCEAVPNTSEAIMVIVKEGGVYLDGRFPIDSIPEELIIFLTQKNNFDIFIYGDVPIAEQPADGKFSFDAGSVKSFTVLTDPVFPTLPLLKTYQFQLVEATLKRQGISGLPLNQAIAVAVLLGAGWMLWSFIASMRAPAVVEQVAQVNPYQGYYDAMRSPAPDAELSAMVSVLNDAITIPGWTLTKVTYTTGSVTCSMLSLGGTVESLMAWADARQATISIISTGVQLILPVKTTPRPEPTQIYPTKETLAVILDRLVKVIPGNSFQMDQVATQGAYTAINTSIIITSLSLSGIDLVAQQLNALPFALTGASLDYANGLFSGNLTLQLLGS
ncbi:MAG TPA: hypothetical protein VFU82_03465 [Gammaproteobacteria bacterium]|jgi:hypothetical protein|nr:hypothetical protein [Gammaproteobacteria bacterium]